MEGLSCLGFLCPARVHVLCESESVSCSDVSDSLRPHGLQPARLLCPCGFSRQEYWSGLLCLPLGDLPDPGIKPRSSVLQADSFTSEPPGEHSCVMCQCCCTFCVSVRMGFVLWVMIHIPRGTVESSDTKDLLCDVYL